MRISAIQVEGTAGPVDITRTATGAQVTVNHAVVCEIARDQDGETRHDLAVLAAAAVYGTDRRGPNATNSMVHDVLDLIELVAGC